MMYWILDDLAYLDFYAGKIFLSNRRTWPGDFFFAHGSKARLGKANLSVESNMPFIFLFICPL